MMSSCIAHPANDPYVMIHSWQMIFCDGNSAAAAALSFFDKWHTYMLNNEECHPHTSYHYEHDLREELREFFDDVEVDEAISLLESKEVITVCLGDDPNFDSNRGRPLLFSIPDINIWLMQHYPLLKNNEESPDEQDVGDADV